MTYRKMIDMLGRIPANHLDDDVTIYDKTEDEYYPVEKVIQVDETQDALDDGHIVLVISK